MRGGPVVADLKIAPREGYARGNDLFEQILRAALAILVDQGAAALTLRNIATGCGLKPGNLAYYFRTKEDLIRELLDAIISGYEEAFDAVLHEPDADVDARFGGLIDLILDDITTKRTTRIFPELWAMANHNAFVHDRVSELYDRARIGLRDLIREINPRLSEAENAALALFVSASMEGMTIFAGHGKPWRPVMPAIKAISKKSFILLVRSIQPGEIDLDPAHS